MEEQQQDEGVIKKTVQIEVEVDTTNSDRLENPYMKMIHLAKAVDAWRFFPRLFLTVYIGLLWKAADWFMMLPDPNTEQSALVSVIVGSGAAWFGLYAGTGKEGMDASRSSAQRDYHNGKR